MMVEERRSQILQLLRLEGRVRVNNLVRRFNTSAPTIRADLNEMHKRGLVHRSHGGAVAPYSTLLESPLQERMLAHVGEKRRIGALAATLIQDGETIILDSGTTTHEVARHLKGKKNLYVITNGVNVANELLGAPGIQIIIVGGTLRNDSASIVGRFGEEMLEQFSADKLFMGGAGCDFEFGVSWANVEETAINRAMLKASQEIILVMDSSKFNKRSVSRIAHFSEVDTVVSDTDMTEEVREKIRALGCELMLA